MTYNRLGVIGAVTVALCCYSGPLRGQSGACPKMNRVPRADRERARVLAKEAAEEHRKLAYKNAADLYRKAAKLWPRPELYRLAGMAYAQAAELLPAYEHLEHALRCGRKVLSQSGYQDAAAVMMRLRPWFAELEVECLQPGLSVRLDGNQWFTCPTGGAGWKRQVVIVGQHEVVATKADHVDMRAPVLVSAGERAVVKAQLVLDEQAMVVARRWAKWKPWAVAMSGLAVGAIGGVLQWDVERRIDSNRQKLDECLNSVGCSNSEIEAYESRQRWPRWESRGAMSCFALGGAALVTGLALVIANRTQLRMNSQAGKADVQVIPMTMRDSGGLLLKVDFRY